MWISIIDTALTFGTLAVAATHLAPLKYKKNIPDLGRMVCHVFDNLRVYPAAQLGARIQRCGVFAGVPDARRALFFTTAGRVGERFFLILSYAAFFTACCAITQMFEAFILPDSDWLYLVFNGVTFFLMLWLFLGKLPPIFRQSAAYTGRATRRSLSAICGA